MDSRYQVRLFKQCSMALQRPLLPEGKSIRAESNGLQRDQLWIWAIGKASDVHSNCKRYEEKELLFRSSKWLRVFLLHQRLQEVTGLDGGYSSRQEVCAQSQRYDTQTFQGQLDNEKVPFTWLLQQWNTRVSLFYKISSLVSNMNCAISILMLTSYCH